MPKKELTTLIAVYPKTLLQKIFLGVPVGLLYAVSLAYNKGYKVKIIDQRIDKFWKESLKKAIKDAHQPRILITTMTGLQIKFALEIARFVKKTNKRITIIFGGIHPSVLPYETLKNKNIDFVVIGDGEETLVELTETLDVDGDLSKVKGIGYKKDNEIIINERRNPFDLNKTLKVPYELIDVNQYTGAIEEKDEFPVVTGRGCVYNCAFCTNTAFKKNNFRKVPLNIIIENIKKGLEFKMKISILDDLFFYDEKEIIKFCDEVEKEGIKTEFFANSRMDFIAKSEIQTLKKIKKTGFKRIYVGIESGSQRILDSVGKGITINQILQGNRKLKKAKIKPSYSFMVGFPTETFDDVKKTISLMIRLKDENPQATILGLKILSLYPGTTLFEELKKTGYEVPKKLEDWIYFDYMEPHNPWLTGKDKKKLQRICLITYFLNEGIQKHLKNRFVKFLVEKYRFVADFRCRHHIYYFAPEIALFKQIKSMQKE